MFTTFMIGLAVWTLCSVVLGLIAGLAIAFRKRDYRPAPVVGARGFEGSYGAEGRVRFPNTTDRGATASRAGASPVRVH